MNQPFPFEVGSTLPSPGSPSSGSHQVSDLFSLSFTLHPTPLALLAVALIVFVGCASGAGDLPVERPAIRITQINTSEFIQQRAGVFAVQYLLEIENTADVPITVDWIELHAGEGGPYTIRQSTTHLEHEVPANSMEEVPISVWAYSYGGRMAAQEPVILRMRVRFQSEKGAFQVREIARIIQ